MKPTNSIGTIPKFRTQTDEQQKIVESDAKSLKIVAAAGSGKSTTLFGYAAARKSVPGLYMVFSKPAEEDANIKLRELGVSTVARTQHSLAYAHFGAALQKAGKLATGLSGAVTANTLDLRNRAMGSAINATLVNYMSSADAIIAEKHLPDSDLYPSARTQPGHVIEQSRKLWAKMTNPADPAKATHDVYLKQWVMTKPVLNYPFILLDECQDSNPLIVGLVNNQKQSTRIYVGDPHQAIFAFRGAIDLMGDLEAEETLRLTNSWRFGPRIGTLASTFLKHWKGESVPIRGCGNPGKFADNDVAAYLTRTVARLIENAVVLQEKGHKLHWIGKEGIANYRTKPILEAYDLFKGVKSQRTDPTLKLMQSWDDFAQYAESGNAGELGPVFKLITRHKERIPSMMRTLEQKQIKAGSVDEALKAGATAIMTTAHKSKGLEFPIVVMDRDFPTLKDAKTEKWLKPTQIAADELNLMYVAMTRAKKGVRLPDELKQFFREQPATTGYFPQEPGAPQQVRVPRQSERENEVPHAA